MSGYLPVLAELKSLLNKWRCVVALEAPRGPTTDGAKPRDDRSIIELHAEKVIMFASFMFGRRRWLWYCGSVLCCLLSSES